MKNTVSPPSTPAAMSPMGSVRVRKTRAASTRALERSARFFTQVSVAATRSDSPSSYCSSFARGTKTFLISSSSIVAGSSPLDTSRPQGARIAIVRPFTSSTIVTSRAGSKPTGLPSAVGLSFRQRSITVSSMFFADCPPAPASPTTMTR